MDTSMSIRRRWLALVAGLGISPMIALAASDNGTITVGEQLGCPGGPPIDTWGFVSSTGSYSPTGLTGGKTVTALYTLKVGTICASPFNGRLEVSGFSSDPGQSWLTSVECNGITATGGTATYFYGSGTSTWAWSGVSWGFPSKAGLQLSCTIVHS